MVYRGGHILRFVVRVLVCAIMCSAVQIGGSHCASAYDIAKVGMALDVESIDEKGSAPNIQSKPRSIHNFIYLLLRKRYGTCRVFRVRSFWVEDLVPEPIWSGNRIYFRLWWWIGPRLYSTDSSDVVRGGTPRISNYESNGNWLTGDQFRSTGSVGVKISTELTDFGIACGSSGVFCRFREPVSGLDGILSIDASAPHLSQLAAHRVPLEQRSEERRDSYAGYHSGPNDQLASDRREPPRFPYKRIFLGIGVIGLGWICLWFSFEAFEKASKSPRYVASGVILGLIAIGLIGHGLFYACLGVWGLPSLYIL